VGFHKQVKTNKKTRKQKMKQLKSLPVFFALLLAFTFSSTLTGCGKVVEVPAAHVGKKSTESGLQEGIIPPSKFRLKGFCWTCDNLILCEASDYPVKETMKIFMPKDKLNLDVDVRGIFSISASESNVEKIFARIPAEPVNDRVSKISMKRVYATYGSPIVREAVRTIITRYTIMEVMENRDAISQELVGLVTKRLRTTPLTTMRFGLADVQPPAIIVKAQEAATKREIEIRQAEADKMVRLKEAEANLEVATKQQQVDLKEAETQVLVAQKLAQGVSPAWALQRGMKVLEKLENGNHVILLPMEAFKNPALMMGIANKAFSKQTVK
jgi:hypothetical protein